MAWKIFVCILLNRRNNHLEQGLPPDSQCGFCHLYSTFVGLTKPFGTVNSEVLRKIMRKFCCPEQFTGTVRQLRDGMMATVTGNRAVSEALASTNDVKQDCVLAPTLVSLLITSMLTDFCRDERPVIRIARLPQVDTNADLDLPPSLK
ncbi:hypothetical protein SprV_0301042800 [Sparganum proliferum]